MKPISLIVVTGPTAGGKTALGIALAQALDGEIVSADSMQIYTGMPIATAAPTEKERALVPHHLVEFLAPDVPFSVAEYVKRADAAIADIVARGKRPIVVGGTGLYISALVDHLDFSAPAGNDAVRRMWEQQYDERGGEALLKQLSQTDAATAARLHPNDKKRVVRALELAQEGTSISRQNQLSRQRGSPYDPVMIGLTYADRDILYERINARVDAMIERGLLEEARHFSGGSTAACAIGHKELKPYFDGLCSLEQAVEHLKQETRRYAKRQLTWFRRDERIFWIKADEEDPFDTAIRYVKGRLAL